MKYIRAYLEISVEKELSNMCRSGGKSFTMRVPVTEKDTDMLLSELFRRFDRYSSNKFNL